MKLKKQNVRLWRVAQLGLLSSLMFLLIGGFVSCKEEYTYKDPRVGGTPFDPNKPVQITELMPDSGGYRTMFVIKGSNFGTDVSKIKVTFNRNRTATIVSSNGEVLYGIVPKQEDGKNEVTVSVEGQEEIVAPQTFRYTKVQQVSTLSGMAGGGYKDGTLIEAKFGYMLGCGIVAGNNLLVAEDKESVCVRMISEAENKVTTLSIGMRFGQPAITKDRMRAYFIENALPHGVYCFSQDKAWASSRVVESLNYIDENGNIGRFTGKIYSCTFADDEEWLYFRDQGGKMGRVNVKKPGYAELLNDKCGNVDGEKSYLAWNTKDKHFYLTLQEANGMYQISPDGKEVEQYAGFNGAGGDDGPRLSTAKMHKPGAMAFDEDGNIIYTETNGHTIRRISLEDGMVSTIAGSYTQAGNADGLPLNARFNYPYGICTDDEYNFYIAEGWGTRIRKFAIE